MDRFGDTNSPRRRQRFQTRGDIDAVAHEIASVDDNVAEIDPDAKTHPIRLGQTSVPFVDLELNFGGASHRLNRTCEFRDYTVPSTSEDASVVVRYQTVDDLSINLESGVRTFFILAH